MISCKIIIPNHIYEEIEEFHYKDVLLKTTTLPPRIWFFSQNRKNCFKYYQIKTCKNYGSRDGISTELFRKQYNGRVTSLVLIKVKITKKIFDEYNSIKFNSFGDDYTENVIGYQFYNSSDNFIFFV